MGHSTDIEILRKRMATGWKVADTGVPLLYDNMKPDAALPTRFVRFSVRPGSEEKRNLGNERHRVECQGRVWLQIAVPIGSHDSEAWALADKAAAVFARWRSSDGSLQCKQIETSITPDTAYYIISVKVLYHSSRVE